MNNATVKPTQVSTVREAITLQSKPKLVVDNTRDHEWLARDIFSTDYATILAD